MKASHSVFFHFSQAQIIHVYLDKPTPSRMLPFFFYIMLISFTHESSCRIR